jgi:hypothetical protein
MPHPNNVQPDPVVMLLTQYATQHGYDYTTALMAAHRTAKDILECNAIELAERTLQRCAS